jgi:membrane protein YqaA with SNARE-associated domain
MRGAAPIVIDDNTVLTPNILGQYELQKASYRDSLTLFRQPVATSRRFLIATSKFLTLTCKTILSHPLFLYFVFPLTSAWAVLRQFDGPHTVYVDKAQFWVEFVVWWVGLGILSSIGLGSGLQSGVLFVFPHIIETCLAAQSCNTLDFETYSNMWFRSPDSLFQCPTTLTATSTPVTYYGTWRKVIIVCFLQAAGTAIGEIPPYWMTRSARLASIEAGIDGSNETLDEIECATPLSIPTTPIKSPARQKKKSVSYTKSYEKMLRRAKIRMIKFLRTHGFSGVLLMASFPNIAFDICGVFCGHYLMPFWTFFSATFIGKAVIRNCTQSLIFVALCRYYDI